MDKQQQVRNFLEKTVREKGFSLNALSLQIGKNSTYLFHFVKRHSPKRLDEESRRALARILDVDEQMLCDFPLPSNLFQDKLSGLYSLFNFNKEKTTDFAALDVIDMGGPNHGNFEKIKRNLIGHVLLSPIVLTATGVTNPQNIKIIKASGDAMEPAIYADDLLWTDTSITSPSADGVYLIETSENVIIRRIQTNPFDGTIEISADNKTYKTYELKDDSKINICGKIIFVTHKLS